MAALHSGETADLRDCLGSDAQTVTALALCQASQFGLPQPWSVWVTDTTAQCLAPAFFALLWPPFPSAVLPPRTLEGKLHWISSSCIWMPVSRPQAGGEGQPGGFNQRAQATSPSSGSSCCFHFIFKMHLFSFL